MVQHNEDYRISDSDPSVVHLGFHKRTNELILFSESLIFRHLKKFNLINHRLPIRRLRNQ